MGVCIDAYKYKPNRNSRTSSHSHSHSNQFDNSQTFQLDQANTILQHPNFRPELKTVLYVHGYLETLDVESIHVIVDAYQQRGDHNIFVLDWATLADGNYLLDAVVNAKQLGPKIAQVVSAWFDAGLSLERFHLVGHSLGGQLVGFVGRHVRSQSGGKYVLPR